MPSGSWRRCEERNASTDAHPIRVSWGCAAAQRHGSLSSAVVAADRSLYGDKARLSGEAELAARRSDAGVVERHQALEVLDSARRARRAVTRLTRSVPKSSTLNEAITDP